MEHRNNDQIKEEKIIFAMELAKQSLEHIEDLLKMETSPKERKAIESAYFNINQGREMLRPTRSLYTLLAEFKELLNHSYETMWKYGSVLNRHRRPNSPHRDPV